MSVGTITTTFPGLLTNVSSYTITKPAQVVDGNMLIAVITNGRTGSASTVTPPAGWTLVNGAPLLYVELNVFTSTSVYWKVAASEGASWAWSFSSVSDVEGGVYVLSGADSVTPVNPSAIYINLTGNTTRGSGLTTINNGSLVLWFEDCFNGTDFNLPSGTNPTFAQDYKGNSLLAFSAQDPIAGPVGTRTRTNQNGATDLGTLILLSVNSAPVTATVGAQSNDSWNIRKMMAY